MTYPLFYSMIHMSVILNGILLNIELALISMQLVTLKINSLKVYWESWSFSIWLGAFRSVPELNFTAGSQMRKPWSWCVDESLILSFAPPTEMKQHEVCLSLKFSSLTQTRWVCTCVWSGWMCAFRSLTFCKIKILNIRTFTQLVAGEKNYSSNEKMGERFLLSF